MAPYLCWINKYLLSTSRWLEIPGTQMWILSFSLHLRAYEVSKKNLQDGGMVDVKGLESFQE